MHLVATLSKLGARKKTTVIPLWTTYSILDPPRLALGIDPRAEESDHCRDEVPSHLRSVAIVQQKALLEKPLLLDPPANYS